MDYVVCSKIYKTCLAAAVLLEIEFEELKTEGGEEVGREPKVTWQLLPHHYPYILPGNVPKRTSRGDQGVSSREEEEMRSSVLLYLWLISPKKRSLGWVPPW